jgi:hypothetical protein
MTSTSDGTGPSADSSTTPCLRMNARARREVIATFCFGQPNYKWKGRGLGPALPFQPSLPLRTAWRAELVRRGPPSRGTRGRRGAQSDHRVSARRRHRLSTGADVPPMPLLGRQEHGAGTAAVAAGNLRGRFRLLFGLPHFFSVFSSLERLFQLCHIQAAALGHAIPISGRRFGRPFHG